MCLRSMNVYRTSVTLQRVGNLVHLSAYIDNREDLIFLFVCLFFFFLVIAQAISRFACAIYCIIN